MVEDAADGLRQRSSEGLIHQSVQELRVVVAYVARCMRHEGNDKLLGRIDPKIGARGARPVEFAGRAHDTRESGYAPHGYAQSKPVAVDIRVRVQLRRIDIGSDVVRRHVLNGLACEYPGAVKLAAGEQHLRKTQVVARRRYGAASAAVELMGLRSIAQRLRLASHGIPRERFCYSAALRRRHRETRVAHLERAKEALLQISRERHACHRFDGEAQDIETESILP